MNTQTKTNKTLTPEYLEWEAKLAELPSILTDKIRSRLYKRYKNKTGLDPWINSEILDKKSLLIPQINVLPISSKPRSQISILPEDPEEKQKHVIKIVLERFPYLTLKHSFKNNYFDFNRSIPCPLCNKNHKKENIRNHIEGFWGSGEYCGEKTYRLYCYTNKYQNSIQIITVKA